MSRIRTFEDVVSAVHTMAGRRPNRSTDNIGMTNRLAERLGLSPMLTKLKVVHVAGTKGKGSTCTFVSKLLCEAYGKRVGLFTSPHLFDVRERIQINNALIDKDKFTEYFFEVHDEMTKIAANSDSDFDRESASRSNFFRFMFLLSLHAFQKENVEIAVYEVGIGGKQDSTNIFPNPLVCGITSLGMDHMEILGDTADLIAAEKAGIIKKDVPCFSSPQRFYPSTRNVLMAEGKKVGAPVIFVDKDVLNARRWPVLSMGGDHFVENSRLALALARTAVGIPVPFPLVRKEWDTLEKTRIEGRSEMIRVVDPLERDPRRKRSASVLMRAIEERLAADGQTKESSKKVVLFDTNDLAFYLDGAHNPESMQVMAEWSFSVAPRGLIPLASRPSSGGSSDGSSLPPTPPPSPRTLSGESKVLPSHLVVTPSATNPSLAAVTRIRTTILFYCTRNPREILRYFMPYHHLIDKIVFCLIPCPKQTAEGTQREAAEIDRLAIPEWLEAWRNLYRDVPCYAASDSFNSINDALEVVRTTPFRERPEVAPSPYGIPKGTTLEAGDDGAAVHIEDRVLVTGSVLFVGDTLKMLHDVGLYPDPTK